MFDVDLLPQYILQGCKKQICMKNMLYNYDDFQTVRYIHDFLNANQYQIIFLLLKDTLNIS